MKEEVQNLVSVIITTCKRKPEIVQRAIKSVLAQTYSPLEIIVVDDSPSSFVQRKEIKKIVESIPSQFNPIYITHEKNFGACKARNTGLTHAQGEFTAYLDDDDEWMPTKIEKQVKKMKECGSTTAMVSCNAFKVYDDGTRKIFRNNTNEKITKNEIYKRNFIGGLSFPLISTSVLKEKNGFDEKMQSVQDTDMWIRILQKYEFSMIAEPLLFYYIHTTGQITSNPAKKLNGTKRLYEKNKVFYQSHKEENYHLLLVISSFYAWNGMLGKALSLWWNCVKIFPLKIFTNLAYALRICKRTAMYWKNRKKICQLQKENPII